MACFPRRASIPTCGKSATTTNPTSRPSLPALVRGGLLTDFQAEQLLHGRSKGFMLSKYLILERLGMTRMSTVFLCQHQAMNRVVCVKVLSQDRAANPARLQRFYREARAAASLDHPHIVRAHDVEEIDRGHLLIMEYVDGPSLEGLVNDHGPLVPLRAAHYIYQAALGLHHAHEKGLVHRDVKPGNFMVDRTGTVKVLDLGLALFNDEESELTQAVLGSVDYLAPEQGVDSHAVDARADIYGLGATFWFLLTGAPPYGGNTLTERVLAHRTRRLKPLGTICPNAPAGLEVIITRMMAKNPEDRYPSAAAVAEVLKPFIEQAVAPPTEAEIPRFSRLTQKLLAPEAAADSAETVAVAAPATGPKRPLADTQRIPKTSTQVVKRATRQRNGKSQRRQPGSSTMSRRRRPIIRAAGGSGG